MVSVSRISLPSHKLNGVDASSVSGVLASKLRGVADLPYRQPKDAIEPIAEGSGAKPSGDGDWYRRQTPDFSRSRYGRDGQSRNSGQDRRTISLRHASPLGRVPEGYLTGGSEVSYDRAGGVLNPVRVGREIDVYG